MKKEREGKSVSLWMSFTRKGEKERICSLSMFVEREKNGWRERENDGERG